MADIRLTNGNDKYEHVQGSNWDNIYGLDGELLAVGDLWLCESSRWRPHGDPGQPLWQPRWQRSTFRLPESGVKGHPGRD